jgi:CxxC motif-containing protein (DUF1111 family)
VRAALPFALVITACASQPLPGEELSGGGATVFDDTSDAYSHPAHGTSPEVEQRFLVGNSFFTDPWVTAPASVETRDGLGPVFNANACAGCHVRDGRGRPPEADEEMVGALVRVSIAGDDGASPVAGYGDQLQTRSIAGVPAEVATRVEWVEIEGGYADGEPYSLRRPVLTIRDPAFGPLPPDLQTSMRVAPAVYGLGLLACVTEATLLEPADPDDANGDGISGRPNRVWDAARGESALGRFGWKANQPSIAQQNQAAFGGDMGLTTPLFPDANCAEGQDACRAAISGGEPEVVPSIVELVDLYVALLAPPARREVGDAEVLRGRDLFTALGCASCHRASMTTGPCEEHPELAHQAIRPFTDLLLHDMGEELADGRPDFEASGREWRTPPLWGVGLLDRVNGHTFLLHDGRARGFAEAILWHGGEAEDAREQFRGLPRADRQALLAFLESL